MNPFIKTLISLSLKNKYFILFMSALLVVAGIRSFHETPVDAFPDVTNTQINIISQWAGRSAEEVEKLVTIPIEIEMNATQNKTHIRSTSIFGLSTVSIQFEDFVTDEQARIQVNNLMANLELPEGVRPEIQPPTGPTGEIYRYTLSSKLYNPMELKTLQDWVIDKELRSVPGIADVVSFGGMVQTYEIKVHPNKLKSLGISLMEVYDAVTKSNVNIGGDLIEKNDQAYIVRGIGLLNDREEIKNVIVTNLEGIPVLIKDIAEVDLAHLPRLGSVGRTDVVDAAFGHQKGIKNDNDVVEGIVLMRRGENPEKVIPRLKEKIKELNESILPGDVQLNTFYDREALTTFATKTVLTNLIEGMLLVTLIVSLFMFNWRTTLIVSLMIPLSLLFAFICLHLLGMPANLLSMGAIDFGIIIDGAVIMVEGVFVAMDKKGKAMGIERFNKMAKKSLIKRYGTGLGKSVFFSKVIIIMALLPIFAFQKVEGKMFSPLAYTLGFALLGALILTLTLVPVLISLLLKKNIKEKKNVFSETLTKWTMKGFNLAFAQKKGAVFLSFLLIIGGLFSFRFVGTEFMPELNEGSLWIRASLPYSVALEKSRRTANEIRMVIAEFPEVQKVLSQAGRPDDGTDITGFYNIECGVSLYPEKQWTSGRDRESLIRDMASALSKIPGIELNFSQPIMDNVEEAVSGVKGSIVAKIYGDSLNYMEGQIDSVAKILQSIEGITDVGVIKNLGQPQIEIDLNQKKMAIYGITTSDANAVIETAIGGKAAGQLYKGIQKFDIRIRFPERFRKNIEQIGHLMIPTMQGAQVPLQEIATIKTINGPSLIFRDDHKRYSAVKFSVRGRDMGGAIKEAQKEVAAAIHLEKGYQLVWQGDFENQERAQKRLAQVVPVSLLLIFLLLFTLFGNFKDVGLVFLNVPVALVGGIMMLLISGTNFSISAGIGFIALFGICILDGVLLITEFRENQSKRKEGRFLSLSEAIQKGVQTLARPILMTALMAMIGLVPAALSTGIGSESPRPLARVVIGGLLLATVFSLIIFPVIYYLAYQGENKKKKKA